MVQKIKIIALFFVVLSVDSFGEFMHYGIRLHSGGVDDNYYIYCSTGGTLSNYDNLTTVSGYAESFRVNQTYSFGSGTIPVRIKITDGISTIYDETENIILVGDPVWIYPARDIYILGASAGPLDTDGDGIPDVDDPDDDNDGLLDADDPFPLDAFGDLDGDGVPDGDDIDIDGDGIFNGSDPFPNNASGDLDGDGVPDHLDGDMDGDGIPNDNDLDPISIPDFVNPFPDVGESSADPYALPDSENNVYVMNLDGMENSLNGIRHGLSQRLDVNQSEIRDNLQGILGELQSAYPAGINEQQLNALLDIKALTQSNIDNDDERNATLDDLLNAVDNSSLRAAFADGLSDSGVVGTLAAIEGSVADNDDPLDGSLHTNVFGGISTEYGNAAGSNIVANVFSKMVDFADGLITPVLPTGLTQIPALAVTLGGHGFNIDWGQYSEFAVIRAIVEWGVRIMFFVAVLNVLRRGVA